MRHLRYKVTAFITLLGLCQSLLSYSGRSACPEFRTVYGALKFITGHTAGDN